MLIWRTRPAPRRGSPGRARPAAAAPRAGRPDLCGRAADAAASIELQGVPGGVYLKLRFEADVHGPCYRCLEDAAVHVSIDAAEYHEPAGGEELSSDYVEADELDAERWARDALVFALPRRSCAGRSARACARAAVCASSRASTTAAARRRSTRAGRSCGAGESQGYSPPAMAVPKRKTSKSRRDKRRATHCISAPSLTVCPQCHAPVRPHHVCRDCGHYRGREVEPLREEAPVDAGTP